MNENKSIDPFGLFLLMMADEDMREDFKNVLESIVKEREEDAEC